MTGTAQAGDRRWRALVGGLGFGTLLNPLNSSLLAVALVTLAEEYHVSAKAIVWVVTVFYLTSAIAQPVMGRVIDLFGARRLFIAGMALCVVASAATPLAPTVPVLCLMRVVFSVGTAVAFPAALALIKYTAGADSERSLTAIARIQLSNASGLVVGPFLGGVIVAWLPWQFLFWVSIPVALLALVTVLMAAPPDARPSYGGAESTRHLDIAGMILLAGFIVPGLLSISAVDGAARVALSVTAVVSLLALRARSRRIADPFLDLRLIGSRSLWPVYVGFLSITVAYYCAFYGLPQYLEEGLGIAPSVVGAVMASVAGASLVANPLVTRLLQRFGMRLTAVTAGALMIVTTVLSMTVLGNGGVWPAFLIAGLLGLPYGMSTIGFGHAVYQRAPVETIGMASGVFLMCRHLAGAVATCVLALALADGRTRESWLEVGACMIAVSLVSMAVVFRWGEAPSPAARR